MTGADIHMKRIDALCVAHAAQPAIRGTVDVE